MTLKPIAPLAVALSIGYVLGLFFLDGASTGTASASSSPLTISVHGNHFVDGAGAPVQLRGVNFSGFEFVPIQGWSSADPSGAQGGQSNGPNWNAISSWGANVVRIPLNEASWLGYTCTDTAGVLHNPDPGGNYRSSIAAQVANANAAGLYVILDLHWAAPGTTCPMLQTQMADADHSIAFWTSVAATYKNNPAVLFELYNEPFFNFDFSGDSWSVLMQGTNGSLTGYPATSNTGNWQNVEKPWTVASYQNLIDAVRATGATNVVLVGTMQYDQDFSQWLRARPTDPLGQMAAVWHPYPTYGAAPGTLAYAEPNGAPQVFSDVQHILDAGIPVLATETGDRSSSGTASAPLVSNITSWADQHGIGVLGWGWDVWSSVDNVLIKDANGTPTDGYGTVFHDWLTQHKANNVVPPTEGPTATSTAYREPYIQDFSPKTGPLGTVVTLIGHGFTGLAAAWVGDAHAAPFTVVSDAEVQVTIPTDATTGAIGLLNPRSASFSAQPFVVEQSVPQRGVPVFSPGPNY